MRIGFDVTPLCVPRSGVGRYTANLLAHLQSLTQDEIVPLAHRVPAANGQSVNGAESALHAIVSPGRGWNKTVWMQGMLPFTLARLGVDLCHFTNSVAALLSPCPTVVTVHDMTLWLYPEYHYRRRMIAMRPFIPLAVRRAAAIIAVSQATKADLVRILGAPAHRVHVVYEAPPAPFRPLPPSPYLDELRRRLPNPFLLYVGTIEPRKNLVRLLEAFARLHTARPLPHHLILVGPTGWKEAPVYAAVERLGIRESVHFLGYVADEMLVALYNLAEALVFPSLYEGFGLPVIEAMACGTPVITSRRGSLGEIAGDAAEFVDPESVADIAEGLLRVLTNPERGMELGQRGRRQAARFSWAEAAVRTRHVYREALRPGC